MNEQSTHADISGCVLCKQADGHALCDIECIQTGDLQVPVNWGKVRISNFFRYFGTTIGGIYRDEKVSEFLKNDAQIVVNNVQIPHESPDQLFLNGGHEVSIPLYPESKFPYGALIVEVKDQSEQTRKLAIFRLKKEVESVCLDTIQTHYGDFTPHFMSDVELVDESTFI